MNARIFLAGVLHRGCMTGRLGMSQRSNWGWVIGRFRPGSTCGGMQEPAQVNADGEGKDVELQRYAAAVTEFQI